MLAVGYYISILLGVAVKVHRQPPHPATKETAPNPPDNIHISVVLMNYARPGLLRRSTLLPTLIHHPSVAEIVLCHANPLTAFHYNHPKVHNTNATDWNNSMGLALRFYACATTAQHDWVLHLDDDMELDESALDQLVATMVANPHRLVGHYARSYSYWRVPHRHGYEYATTLFGNTMEVILTKVVLMERAVCTSFVHRMSLMDDLVRTSVPLWNGEDIFASLVANDMYGGSYNVAIEGLHVWEADNALKDDDAGAADISANLDRHPFRLWTLADFATSRWRAWRHAYYRGRFWSIAKSRLAALREIEASSSAV